MRVNEALEAEYKREREHPRLRRAMGMRGGRVSDLTSFGLASVNIRLVPLQRPPEGAGRCL